MFMLFEPMRVVTSAKTPGLFSTGTATSTFSPLLLDEDAAEGVVGLAGLQEAPSMASRSLISLPSWAIAPANAPAPHRARGVLRQDVRPQLGVGRPHPGEVPERGTGEGERLGRDVRGDLQERRRHEVRQVREGGHEEVVLLRVDGGRDGAELPDEPGDLAVGVRVGAAGRGEEVAGALEEVGPRCATPESWLPAIGCPPTKRRLVFSASRTMALLALATSVTRASVGGSSATRSVTLDMGAASTTRSAPRTSLSVEARWMAPDDTASSRTSGLSTPITSHPASRAARPTEPPIRPTPTDPQRAAHESAPMTRSFSPESPMVTRLQPGIAERLAFPHEDPGPLEDLRSRLDQNEVALRGDVVEPRLRKASCTRSRSRITNSARSRSSRWRASRPWRRPGRRGLRRRGTGPSRRSRLPAR